MKTATLRIVHLVWIMFLASSLFAQQKKMSAEDRSNKVTEWMKTNLKLSDDQTTKVSAINLKYAQKNEDLQSSPSSRRQKFELLKANDEAKDKELHDVLSDDQFKAYQAKKDEVKKMMKEKAKKKKHG